MSQPLPTLETQPMRYHGLDALRAAAMLLGVFFHALLFGGMFGSGPPGGFPGGPGGINGSAITQNWLHSFRMPLFFLISGFFCAMMLGKYGLWRYLLRRWWRLGIGLLVSIFTFVPLYQLASDTFRGGPRMGGPGGMGPGGFPGGPGNGLWEPPQPPPGFVPPPLEPFDTNQDGTIDDEEWVIAKKAILEGRVAPGGPVPIFPGFGPGGPNPDRQGFPGQGKMGPGQGKMFPGQGKMGPNQGKMFPGQGKGFPKGGDRPGQGKGFGPNPGPGFARGPMGNPKGGFRPGPVPGVDGEGDGAEPAGERDRFMGPGMGAGPGGPPRGPGARGPGGPGGMFGPPGEVSSWLFGSSVRYFTLSHLWFLWYLLVFATAAPFLGLGWSGLAARVPLLGDGVVWLVRCQAMPIVLGLLSIPLLMLAPGFMGWSLGFASGIGKGFPDFLWHLEPDMPFYFAFFWVGWLLYLSRAQLVFVARWWWLHLGLGIAAHMGAEMVSRAYFFQTDLESYPAWRILGFGLYALGSAWTAWGFVGMFQSFFDRPSVVGKYFADTAFWVYLLHQALLMPVLSWLAPFGWPWYANGLAATALTMIGALLLYEAMVRHTILAAIFGPGAASRKPKTIGQQEQLIAAPSIQPA